jgi:hypothetical protein
MLSKTSVTCGKSDSENTLLVSLVRNSQAVYKSDSDPSEG